jgi:alpha-tubulin suppressor-like RCC1 family protein
MYHIKNSDKSTTTHTIRHLFDNKRVIDLIAGEDHALALTEDGCVYSYGSTTYGATGRSGATNNPYDGKIEWGKVDIPEKVTQISAGRLFSYALVGPRKCYSFGVNNCAMVCELFLVLIRSLVLKTI